MRRPKIRIGTLMLLVVIIALAVALVVERGKSRRLAAEKEVEAAQAEYHRAEYRRATALAEAVNVLAEAVNALSRARPFNLEPVVFSEVAAGIAADDLGGVPAKEVEADLAAIVEGATRPVEITDASAAYVVYRRDKKQTRAGAVRSARLELRLKSAADVVEKARAK